MILQFPFKPEVRNLYLGVWYCFKCGGNGWNRGGLELHHLMGRVSDSALNSCLLCGFCHSRISHNLDEHRELFIATLDFLKSIHYVMKKEDLEFLVKNERELIGKHLDVWLMS